MPCIVAWHRDVEGAETTIEAYRAYWFTTTRIVMVTGIMMTAGVAATKPLIIAMGLIRATQIHQAVISMSLNEIGDNSTL
jgi:hypothetical protein